MAKIESEIREMRNLIYENEISDKEWAICRQHWLMPIEVKWLENQLIKMEKNGTLHN